MTNEQAPRLRRRDDAQPDRQSGPAEVVMLVLLGAAIGALVLLVGAQSEKNSREFVHTTPFFVWAVVITAQAALWAVSASVILVSRRRLRQHFRDGAREMWVASLAFAAALALPAALPRIVPSIRLNSPLLYHPYRMGILLTLGGLVGLLAVQAVTLVHRAAVDAPSPLAERLDRFLSLRDELDTLLLFLGMMIGAATLATGALRNALISHQDITKGQFPPTAVLAYGGYFTLLLAAVYAPAYAAVVRLGRAIRDRVCGRLPERPEDPDSWAAWQSRRATVEDVLQLNVTTTQKLQKALAILAPVTGSAVSLLLGNGK